MTCSPVTHGRRVSEVARAEWIEAETHVGDAALVGRVRVAVDGEEVRQALPQLGVVGRLARKVQEHEP